MSRSSTPKAGGRPPCTSASSKKTVRNSAAASWTSRPGKTGYVYLLGGSGDQKGRYLISYKGERDGENIWDSKDADGHFFIQSLIHKARDTKDGQCVFERYLWQNKGERAAALENRRRHLLRAVGLRHRRRRLRSRLPRRQRPRLGRVGPRSCYWSVFSAWARSSCAAALP